jgi:membrane-associated protease RseP (regulator of RpoE activity)
VSLLHTIVSFIVALGILIVVHEFGHYIVARWAGVKVLRFCVGFGRPLWSRRFFVAPGVTFCAHARCTAAPSSLPESAG